VHEIVDFVPKGGRKLESCGIIPIDASPRDDCPMGSAKLRSLASPKSAARCGVRRSNRFDRSCLRHSRERMCPSLRGRTDRAAIGDRSSSRKIFASVERSSRSMRVLASRSHARSSSGSSETRVCLYAMSKPTWRDSTRATLAHAQRSECDRVLTMIVMTIDDESPRIRSREGTRERSSIASRPRAATLLGGSSIAEAIERWGPNTRTAHHPRSRSRSSSRSHPEVPIRGSGTPPRRVRDRHPGGGIGNRFGARTDPEKKVKKVPSQGVRTPRTSPCLGVENIGHTLPRKKR
jgi:hypothetical protein